MLGVMKMCLLSYLTSASLSGLMSNKGTYSCCCPGHLRTPERMYAAPAPLAQLRIPGCWVVSHFPAWSGASGSVAITACHEPTLANGVVHVPPWFSL